MNNYFYKNENEILGPISLEELLKNPIINYSTLLCLSSNNINSSINWFPANDLFEDIEEENKIKENKIKEENKNKKKEIRRKNIDRIHPINLIFSILTIIGIFFGSYFLKIALFEDTVFKQGVAGIFACAFFILPYCLQKTIKELI